MERSGSKSLIDSRSELRDGVASRKVNDGSGDSGDGHGPMNRLLLTEEPVGSMRADPRLAHARCAVGRNLERAPSQSAEPPQFGRSVV